jgi:Antitoxin of toxin-antitoxin, RelE / RelB, TA system
MATVSSLPTRGLSEAKAALSDVMSGVVHDHRPTVIERHGGKEAMLLLGLSDIGPLLDHFSFHTLSSVSDGEFVLRQEELGLVAGGETFEQAASELEELALTYAERYFERLHFYAQTDRAEQMPWLLRLILIPEAERRALLIGAPEHPPGA